MTRDTAPALDGGGVLCVYYKVDAVQHAALVHRVRAFQATCSQRWPGLECELLQRPQAAQGVETWMEIYRGPARAESPGQLVLDDELIDAIERAAAAADLPLPRQVEYFIDIVP